MRKLKTKEELIAIKEEYDNLNKKLKELNEQELAEVIGGLHNLPEKRPDEKYVMTSIPRPVPLDPVVSKKCLNKPCSYNSKEECPYYSKEIGDCKF